MKKPTVWYCSRLMKARDVKKYARLAMQNLSNKKASVPAEALR